MSRPEQKSHKLRVLVIDDEPAVRFGIRDFLETHDFEVEEAADRRSAHLAFTRNRPDAVILDYLLPDGHTLDLMAKLKGIDANVPILILTAHGSIDLAVRAIKEGADQFLTKPMDLPALLVLLEREIEKAELAKAHKELRSRAQDLEAMIAERTTHLQATIAELEGVSYSLSHDMRAPLRTIQSFSQIVLADAKEKLGPEEKELLQKTISAAGRLDRLIQDVLIYSQVARESIELKPLDMEQLLRQIVHERSDWQPPRAEIEIRGPLAPVRAHEAYLTQCITNLLDNAVKFVPTGRQPRICIWNEAMKNQVRIWFEDNGIGIPKEAQERVFGMFERVHGEKVYPGTGIGLAIVRKAVERMGGAAGVESGVGKGSRFWLQLAGA